VLTLILITLLAAALLLLPLRWKRTGLGLLLLALALFWLAGNGVLTAPLLNRVQGTQARLREPRWGARNAVVLLGTGVVRTPAGDFQPLPLAHARILEAVRQYRACLAAGRPCTLLISGGDALKVGATEAAVYRDEALGLGVAAADLLLEPRSLNTFKNAEYSSALLKAGGYDTVVLVTSGLHLRRSLMYFDHFGSHCQGAPADHFQVRSSRLPLSYNLTLADMAIHEWLGLVRYRVYGRMGWNLKPVDKVGAV
jgi:uncharacterized SAM-binding protein YcdF (DUF218 family)